MATDLKEEDEPKAIPSPRNNRHGIGHSLQCDANTTNNKSLCILHKLVSLGRTLHGHLWLHHRIQPCSHPEKSRHFARLAPYFVHPRYVYDPSGRSALLEQNTREAQARNMGEFSLALGRRKRLGLARAALPIKASSHNRCPLGPRSVHPLLDADQPLDGRDEETHALLACILRVVRGGELPSSAIPGRPPTLLVHLVAGPQELCLRSRHGRDFNDFLLRHSYH